MAKKKRSPKNRKPKSTRVIHATSGGHHDAGWNLSVFVMPDGDYWYAQGVEMDYGAQGTTIADARANFQRGFAATVKRHLAMFGNVEGLLKFASADLLKEAARNKDRMGASMTRSLHRILDAHELRALPFDGLEFRILRTEEKEVASREAA